MELDKARKVSNALKPAIQIGKNGLTESSIEEIKKNLKKRRLIKIKCIRYFIDSVEGSNTKEKIKNTANTIAEKTNAKIISIVGFTITIGKNIGSLKESDLKK